MQALEKILKGRKSLCFIDLEGTQFSHEMIAIGAVKVDVKRDGSVKKIHKGYYTLVKPKSRIGKVVTDLTGITEKDVKEKGVPFRIVMRDLKNIWALISQSVYLLLSEITTLESWLNHLLITLTLIRKT